MNVMMVEINAQPSDMVGFDDKKKVGICRTCITSNFLSPPYISSGLSSELIIVNRKSNVQSAIRSGTPNMDDIQKEIVSLVKKMGSDLGWGNLFDYSEEGLLEARKYIGYYGDWDLELFCGDNQLGGVVVDWLEPGNGILIVKEKEYFGDIILYGDSAYSIFVHNPGRTISILSKEEKIV